MNCDHASDKQALFDWIDKNIGMAETADWLNHSEVVS